MGISFVWPVVFWGSPIWALKEKKTHLWLNDEITRLTDEKAKAEGTEREKEAIQACSSAKSKAKYDYVAKTSQELRDMKLGTKPWWKKSGEILGDVRPRA